MRVIDCARMESTAGRGRDSSVKIAGVALLALLAVALLVVALLAVAPAGKAAFPGSNGKIVFVSNNDIFVMNTDGSGVTNLTNSPAFTDDSPAFSPDGNRIVYTSTASGSVDIFSMNADGTNVSQLMNDAAWDAHPAWSPDGTKIVFQSDRAGGGNWEIYAIDANGANLTRLTNVLANDSEPAWSPDGTKIAFTSYRDGNAEIYTMDAGGANQANITNNSSKDESPVWSPDGTMIAFDSRRTANNEEIFRMAADGSAVTQVTFAEFSPETLPAWSPDGTKIAFVSGSDTIAEIYSISVPGTQQSPWIRLTNDTAQSGHPDWQPALAPAAHSQPAGANGRIAIKKIDAQGMGIWLINSDGSGEIDLTASSNPDHDPNFSPDGSKIAFTSFREDNNGEIYIMNADGSGQTRLTINNTEADYYPSFFPDGRRILFTSNRSGNDEIYTMKTDGSDVTRLTSSTATDYMPASSPDGSRIAFASYRDGNGEIYVMNASGSVQTRLTSVTGNDFGPAFSPDGRKIAFVSQRDGNSEIYLMDADGSNQMRLTSNSASDFDPDWSPDGATIVFSSDRDGGDGIYTMNIDGSSQTKLGINSPLNRHPSWQPLPNYHWTWYDNVGGSNWVLLANPASASKTLTYGLTIGGAPADLSPFGNGIVVPGQSVTPSYGALMGGPVVATSTGGGRGIVSQRSLWPKGGSSIEEVIGTDRGRLSSHFYWTWYDQLSPGMANWVMVANPGTDTVTAEVSFRNAADGQMVTGIRPGIAPGESWPFVFPGKMGGPVEVIAYRTGGDWNVETDRRAVLASQRVLSGGGDAFNEGVGVPAEELSDDYYWPWFDDVFGMNWLLLANPGIAPVTYRIDIGGGCDGNGTWNGTPNTICQTGSINGGEIIPQRLGVINGPVHVYSLNGGSLIASQRIVFGPSFGETLGYPANALASTYHWTWYDQLTAGMLNWVLIANPSTTDTIDVQVWMAGQQAQENVGPGGAPTNWTLAPGAKVTPRFGSYMGGPVEVRAYLSGTSTPAPGGAIVSQRVLYNGYFNEVPGTVLR